MGEGLETMNWQNKQAEEGFVSWRENCIVGYQPYPMGRLRSPRSEALHISLNEMGGEGSGELPQEQ